MNRLKHTTYTLEYRVLLAEYSSKFYNGDLIKKMRID